MVFKMYFLFIRVLSSIIHYNIIVHSVSISLIINEMLSNSTILIYTTNNSEAV